MSTHKQPNDAIVACDLATIPGLTFRPFRGEVDYPAMIAVIEGSKQADGIERTDSVQDIARNYQHLINCDPYQDTLFAEINGQVIGYGRLWWQQEPDGTRRYMHFTFLLPAWRGQGIRRAMLNHNEHRLREIAAGHPADGPRFLEAWAADTEVDWASLLVSQSYQPVRYQFHMVRPDLENIPNLPLPEGLQIRPVQPEYYRTIWRAAREAFRDEWSYSEDEWTDEHLIAWQQEPTFTPHLWQVAWEGDQVAGMVMNFIDQEQNREYNRKRGYTEGICVRRPWRRRGLARALIARSFQILKAQGMTQAALGVDAENPNGALQLYKSMGFCVTKQHTTYRKLLDPPHIL